MVWGGCNFWLSGIPASGYQSGDNKSIFALNVSFGRQTEETVSIWDAVFLKTSAVKRIVTKLYNRAYKPLNLKLNNSLKN